MKNYGSIYLRKDGLYCGRVQYKGIKKQVYGHKRDEIQTELNDFVNELKYNKVGLHNALLFSEYVSNYLYTYKYGYIKDSSFDRLECVLKNHIKGSDIDISLYKMDDVCVQRFLNAKSMTVSVSNMKKIYDLVRAVLLYAYRRKDIDIDYASLLVLPVCKKKVKQIEVYTDNEVDNLVNGIVSAVSSPSGFREVRLFRYALSFVIILNTGLRAGEMLALTWDNVDLEHNVVHVVQSLSHTRDRDEQREKSFKDTIETVKTEKSIRDIPLNATARQCFLSLKMDCCGEYVVHNLDGDFMKLRSYQQTFEHVCKYLGVPYKGLHALRHTFASRLIAKGVAPKVVSDLLGHSSVVFTLNRYVHSYDDNVKDAVNLLDVSEQ